MKRAIGFLIILIACLAGFLSVRGTMPFIPIFGSSMEPTLQSGGLLLIEPIDPNEVEVGDIIIYNVPTLIRDYYNYPPTVAHRVIEVYRDHPGLRFRTKGDNTGEDPFSVRPDDIKGTIGDQIPHLGLPLLFFQSQQGLFFTAIALALLALFLYTDELSLGGRKLHRIAFSPVIQASYRNNRVLAQKIEGTESRMNATEQALEKFAGAIELYAQHLSSHTSAIQGLAGASHELKNSAAEQNRVLMHLMRNMGTFPQIDAGTPEAPEINPADSTPARPAGEITMRIEGGTPDLEKLIPEIEKRLKGAFPPGCSIGRKSSDENNRA